MSIFLLNHQAEVEIEFTPQKGLLIKQDTDVIFVELDYVEIFLEKLNLAIGNE